MKALRKLLARKSHARLYTRANEVRTATELITNSRAMIDQNCALESKKTSKDATPLLVGYLAFYNFVHFLGWTAVTYLILFSYGLDDAWRELRLLVWFLQAWVLLDVLHILLGLVRTRSDVSIPLTIHCKVTRRLQLLICLELVCGGAGAFSFSQSPHSVPPSVCARQYLIALMLLSWSVLDMIRYSFYFLHVLKIVPHWMMLLRYSEFIISYPLGMLAEFAVWFMILSASPYSRFFSLVIGFYLCWRIVKFPSNYGKMWKEFNKRKS
jgi:very-long-chain (3R)-3-hydroxyacyl-CoA dehydratase